MTKVRAWVSAFRLRTLPLALSTIIMGGFLAQFYGMFKWSVFLLAIITTLFLQVLSNLANDYGDTVNGADHKGRQGPQRMVQSGLISQKSMRRAIAICASLALVSGILLIYFSFSQAASISGLVFFLLGVASIVAALKYTMGKNPYGYQGHGDLFVLLFFGLVGVGGSFYLHGQMLHWDVLYPALAVGFLSTGVLNLNNMRDRQSDKEAGKNTLVVKKGIVWAKRYHYLLVIGALLLSTVFVVTNGYQMSMFMFLLSTPLFIRHLWVVNKAAEADDFDPELKKLAISSLVYVLLFGTGLILT
ncbi:1,4-dihydroxy-2-naphthoate polyprenyltransferase [Carboxylicivirga sediminis]|uniref:1,4-dihydroxy-2-naphthoate octaprenyltransferase n=1 Tax=Carboxylicivirga sediminis TaxID=2006564 RepID=A0A941F345_9BACT|nr:1,4-dihydroxy-2-naphthoate polyprenyltransferase [Carboxylicivirga sediminis]MBR8535238.1 1,4-dihydroxy-2-naphthoate polyprenyltransferase [Carboxylicivirga sediminis]